MLHLPVGRDLALQLDQLLGLPVHAAQHLQADRAQEDEQRHHGEERDQELGLHPRRHARDEADGKVAQAHQGSFSRLQEVVPELLRIEAVAEILDAHGALPVDQRGQQRVVDLAVRRPRHGHAVPLAPLRALPPVAGEEAPAREIGVERSRILLQHLGRVVLGIDRDRDEGDLAAEVRPQLVLHLRHLVGEQRADVGAGSVDEGHRDDLAAEIAPA